MKRYPITMMGAACLPWGDDFSFQEEIFRKHIRAMVAANLKSFYILGTAGEGYAVSEEMFKYIVRVFAEETRRPDLMPMVCVLSLSLDEMLKRIELSKGYGIKDFQIACPAWGSLSKEEMFAFFHTVCDRFPDCRFIHYNNWNRSKTKVTINDYVSLAKEIPNLCAVKYSTMNILEIEQIVKTECPLTFYFVDNGYSYGSMFGECGFLNSFCYLDFGLAWKHFEAGKEKNLLMLIKLENYLFDLNEAFSDLPDDKIDSAYDKSIAKITLPEMSQRLYPPYKGFTDEEFSLLKGKVVNVVNKHRALLSE